MKKLTIKIIALFLFSGYVLSNASCDLVEKLEPKDFEEIFLDKIVDKEWNVDTIKYTRIDQFGKLVYDSIAPQGKILIKRPGDASITTPGLGMFMSVMYHTYSKNNAEVTDTLVYETKFSGTSVGYIDFISTYYPQYPTYAQGLKTTYDVKQVDNNKFHLERNETVLDGFNNVGSLRSVYKLSR